MKIRGADTAFYKRFAGIAVPIAVQQLLSSLMYFVDNIMIGSLGESAIVGVGNANQIAFFILISMIGICSTGWVFAARFNGEGDKHGIKITLGVCLFGTIAIGTVFFLLALIIPEQLIAIFNDLPSVQKAGGEYIRIVGVSYIFSAVSMSYANVLKGCQRTKLPMMTTFVSISVNAFLNYVLIFGRLGFPELGVRGAAIGTAAGAFLNAALLVIIPRLKKSSMCGSLSELIRSRKELKPFLRQFIKVGTPMMAAEVLWALFSMLLVALYNRMGLEVAAAMAVYVAVEKMSLVVYIALAHSSGVMIGNYIGTKEFEKAHYYGKRFIAITPVSTLIVGALVLAGLPLFLAQYDISSVTLDLTRKVVYGYLGLSCILMTNFTLLIGILRGGGDTRYATIVELSASFLITLPLAYVTALLLDWPVYFVMLFAYGLGDAVKLIFGLKRFFSRKWIHDITSAIRD